MRDDTHTPDSVAARPDVLLVDDDPFIQQIAAYLLRRQHWRILQAADGLAALHLLEHERPRVVVTDVDMPEIDGLELTRRVADRFPGMLVVVMSGDAEGQSAECLRVGAECVLEKAALGSMLVPTVSRLLMQRCDAVRTSPLQRDAMRFAGGGFVELIAEDDRRWSGIVVDASFAGLAVQANDVSLLRVGQVVRIHYGRIERSATVRNIHAGQSGCGRVGLEWASDETPLA